MHLITSKEDNGAFWSKESGNTNEGRMQAFQRNGWSHICPTLKLSRTFTTPQKKPNVCIFFF